ncbi:MAG: protein kinase [Cyanobacteria bacterium HKST-UBA02]|nr:protein kinase [Cyanobacteria bacterium HKST-UBA02]
MSEKGKQAGASEEICHRCGQPKKSSREGTFTRWIVACTCDLASEEESVVPVETAHFCATCGKRIGVGRQGSFTQWIFRSDICSCETPVVFQRQVPIDRESSTGATGAFDADSEEPELVPDPEVAEYAEAIGSIAGDRYRPISLLGAGATGTVILCRDHLLQKNVAIKCLRVLGEEQVIRFQQEARAASKLSHPNVVTVLDFGASTEGEPYLVMDLVNGISLDRFIEEHGPMPAERAIVIIEKICSALDHAHETGIFHRDVKSSNILLEESGAELEPFLIDFGVARFKSDNYAVDEETAGSNTLVGSPGYMAPDAASGMTYDRRSEIYSLGCVLYESLTGHVPFAEATALETISMHAHRPAPALAEGLEGATFSDELEGLVARCLEKDPENRYQTMLELKGALERLQTRPVPVTEAPAASLEPKRSPVLKAVLIIGSAFFLPVLALLAYYEMSPADNRVKNPAKKSQARSEVSASARPKSAGVSGTSDTSTDLSSMPDLSESDSAEFGFDMGSSPTREGLSAPEYYHQALGFKNMGMPNEARLAMNKAAEVGDPAMKAKAERFLRVHIPQTKIPMDAVYANIDAYTKMSAALPSTGADYELHPEIKNDPNALEAVRRWHEMIKTYPSFEWPFMDLGLFHLRTGNYVEAEKMYRKVLDIHPECYEPWVIIGIINERQGKLEKAMKCIERAIELDPEPVDARRIRVRLLRKMQSPKKEKHMP